VDRPAVLKYFREFMFSVEPLYDKGAGRFARFRSVVDGRVAYDSGGFAFLLGKIKSPPDPKRTAQIYRILGYTEKDILIQLDLPPQYYMSREERLKLIEKSAEYYWVMRSELGENLLGVVHGWTLEELKYSLSLLEDPDRVAHGCNFTTMKVYVHDYIQKKRVALGSYNVKSVLAERVATPSCTAEMVVCRKRVPRRVVFERLVLSMNLLREKEVFVLGGSGPNSAHLLFFLGGKYIDGASWRLAAKLWRIYVPHLGEFSVGRKKIAKRLDGTAVATMKEYYRDFPCSLSFDEFIKEISRSSGGFELRALWNAFVLKIEEKIANEYSADPDRYYVYLRKRWDKSPYWKKILDFCYRRIVRPYIHYDLTIFFKENMKSEVR